jgi:hypothetical protein
MRIAKVYSMEKKRQELENDVKMRKLEILVFKEEKKNRK